MAHRLNFYDPFSGSAELHFKRDGPLKGPLKSAIPAAAFPSFAIPATTISGAVIPIVAAGAVIPGAVVPDVAIPAAPERLQFPIKGQGVIALRVPAGGHSLQIVVSTSSAGENVPEKLFLILGTDTCALKYGVSPGNSVAIDWTPLKTMNACYFQPGHEDTYWLSVDRHNGWIRFGRTLTSASMALGEAQLKERTAGGVDVWREQETFSWLDRVQDVDFSVGGVEKTSVRTAILANPLVVDLPPFIADGRKPITLIHLEANTLTVPENLTPECQRLYHNVAGAGITLDEPDDPNNTYADNPSKFRFSTAIEESVNTRGKLGWKMLWRKVRAGGHDIPEEEEDVNNEFFKGTYLRITLGRNMGDSPGVPYVLEIWPAGHHSPIHDHGDSNAIIKVLHGTIHATYYTSLEDPIATGREATLEEGDITWLDPRNYQIHKLENLAAPGPHAPVCCTIQCYRYAANDSVRFEGFRFVPADGGEPRAFTPNSDMAYSDFLRDIKNEWEEAHPAPAPPALDGE